MLIAYFVSPWSRDPVTPKHVLDMIRGETNAPDLDTVLGIADPAAEFDAALAAQQARR